jgi:hypothetical protein
MARRQRSKWAKSERNRIEAPFAPFPCEMIESAAFRALSGSALKILFHLTTVWARSGGIAANTNGELVATYERFRRFWGMDSHTAAAAMRQLIALGFIGRKKGASGNAGEYAPSTYRLTFLPAEGVAGTGSHEWKRIAPEDAKRIANKALRTPGDGARRVRRHHASHMNDVTDVTDKFKIPMGECDGYQGEKPQISVTSVTDVTDLPRGETHLLYISRPEAPQARPSSRSPRRSRGDGQRLNRADPVPGGERPCVSALPVPIHLGPARCEGCGNEIQSRRIDARFCSGRCRMRAQREKH